MVSTRNRKSPFLKALDFIKGGKIRELGRGEFEVDSVDENGEEVTHSVSYRDSKVSCDCRYFSLEGCRRIKKLDNKLSAPTDGRLCGHVQGVIIYCALKKLGLLDTVNSNLAEEPLANLLVDRDIQCVNHLSLKEEA